MQWAFFGGQGDGWFEDIDYITMFADYRVPQVLLHFNAMVYDDHLMQMLKDGKYHFFLLKPQKFRANSIVHVFPADKILENGSAEEVEIRGVSIFIVEELKKLVIAEMEANYPDVPRTNINSILIDHFLWDYRRRFAKELEHIPFHKTISIFY